MNTVDSLLFRIVGMLRRPRATLTRAVATREWARMLAATFALSAVVSALLFGTETGRLALLDQWERTADAFGRPVTDLQYASLRATTAYGPLYGVADAAVRGPLLALGLAALLASASRRAAGRPAPVAELLAVTTHAGVILALRQVVTAPVAYARETLASPFTLGLLAPGLDEANPLARFLGILDLFVIWWIIVLALGTAIVYQRPARRLAALFLTAYLTLAAGLAAVMALTGGGG